MITFKVRAKDKDIFDAMVDGSKKVETRAATVKFSNLKRGDKVLLVCGQNKAEKIVKSVDHFRTIDDLLTKVNLKDINPKISTREELMKMYYSFPGYKEKLKKYGLVALEFE